MKTISVIGLGLIGGSFAMALNKVGVAEKIIGVDQNEEHQKQALALGIVQEIVSLDEAIKQSDLIVIAVPINIIQTLLPEILDKIDDKTIVMDMGSTKAGICKKIINHPKREQFVATHPIAGTENSGPNAAFAELFLNKVAILCDIEKSNKEAVKKVKKIYQSLWMNVKTMTSKAHDAHIAYVSHLSHITSFALGQTVLEEEKNEEAIFDMAGSGFESTVRLAKSSPDMWTPIFIQNKENLLNAIDAYQDQISKIRNMIEEENSKEIHRYLENTNDIRRILNKK
ncbi:prephenate dehydrogenase [Chishuiella changwenlii]|uniref:Prephenate dehydrogenase n=1 Tax=Chishuiella changwenlii TaxID=1434701 RepID=A0A1M6ZR06_9FLAO|nr:prephenate dehydrogenase [Chishuiella changwenlii]GGE92845.1 prephenate dehydrogenase [Chishuiella changwenlii]SHL32874.1 prephenate dehydrogenase [Chishuiella changwenlii]